MFIIGSAEFLLLIGIFVVLGIQIWALVDIARRNETDWRSIDESRTAWFAVAFLGSFLGAVLYLVHVRPKFAKLLASPTAAF